MLQLADSAFPAGGFAHSLGFEALRALGLLADEAAVRARLAELAWQTAYGALPFLGAAWADAPAADRACDRFLVGHIANRASRAQGRALLLVAEEMFGRAAPALPFVHHCVALGAVLAARAVALADARQLALSGALRSAASAAVRLGALGPLRAQRVLLETAPIAEAALAETAKLQPADARTIAPLVELASAAHDRLYARLFQS